MQKIGKEMWKKEKDISREWQSSHSYHKGKASNLNNAGDAKTKK